jgi:hypothetical protein
MSSTTRTVVLVLAALVIAAGAFLVLRPDDDEETASSTTTVTTTAPATTPATTTTSTPTATTGVPVPTVTRIALKGGAPVGGVEKIDVDKGDVIRMTVTSDTADEVHVHGFDLEQEVSPGNPARFRFTADIEGRFEVESHETATPIAEITVNP